MHVLDLFNDKERRFLNGGPLEEADGKQRMSRAAKGHEKYGKEGMAALAKAGREGAGEEQLDKIRDKHDKYNEGVAGPKNCWPGHRKVGTKPGTGRNAGKRVNDCEKIGEAHANEGQLGNPGEPDSPVAQAIVRRILMQRTDLLAKHGPNKVSAAVDEVADFVGEVDEIGSSDVSGWVRHVEQMLGNMDQGVAEGVAETLPFDDAVKVLRHYGATNLKTTSNELHFYKQGRPFSVDLIMNSDATRSVSLSQLNSVSRKLKGQGIDEATGDKPFDDMMKTIKKGTAKQATADRREQRKQSQQQARDAFGPNPAANLGIRKPPVSEGDTEQKPRIRKYTKMRPDGSKAIRYEVLDYMGRRAEGQGTEGFDDLKNAKQFYYRNRINLVAPVDESVADNNIVDNTQIETIGMKESSRYWCKEEKRWKDNK